MGLIKKDASVMKPVFVGDYPCSEEVEEEERGSFLKSSATLETYLTLHNRN